MEVRIPAGTQAYMFVVRDYEHDKFDVKKFVYNYINEDVVSINLGPVPLSMFAISEPAISGPGHSTE